MTYDIAVHWIKERESIRIRKESNAPYPWTDDPILRDYRFCCVRREDDRVTKWIDANVRRPFQNNPNLWLMLCVCRIVNWPDTLAELISTPRAFPIDDGLYNHKVAIADGGVCNRKYSILACTQYYRICAYTSFCWRIFHMIGIS